MSWCLCPFKNEAYGPVVHVLYKKNKRKQETPTIKKKKPTTNLTFRMIFRFHGRYKEVVVTSKCSFYFNSGIDSF